MKAYVKPELTALSLSGNEVLCGGCSDNGGFPLGDPDIAQDFMEWDTNNDGTISANEVDDAIAADNTYCKFSYAITVIWS